jgi:hypothetical protein
MGLDREAVLYARTADNIPPAAPRLHFGAGGKIPGMSGDPLADRPAPVTPVFR